MAEQVEAKKCPVCDKLFNGTRNAVFCDSCKECLSSIVNLVNEFKKIKEDPSSLEKLTGAFNIPGLSDLTGLQQTEPGD